MGENFGPPAAVGKCIFLPPFRPKSVFGIVAADVRRRRVERFSGQNRPPHVGGYNATPANPLPLTG